MFKQACCRSIGQTILLLKTLPAVNGDLLGFIPFSPTYGPDDVGFNLSNIKQIRVNDSNNLREQLKQQIAIYYGLTELGD